MCNLIAPTSREKVVLRHFVEPFRGAYGATAGPLQPALIVTPSSALVAQWGMIQTHSDSRIPKTSSGARMSTNNARRERMATAPTYRDAWRKGQRCIIPADSYDEPFWGTGKNIWWRFWREDGAPWALAGLWSEWKDPQFGENVPSFTMITQNCDGHPLLGLMHKPNFKLPSDHQDKRTIVSLEPHQWDQWLNGTNDEAEVLIQVPGIELFKHGAANPEQHLDILAGDFSSGTAATTTAQSTLF